MRVEPADLEPGLGAPGDPVERDERDGPAGERRVLREPRDAERSVRTAVRREEDERVQRRSRGLRRPRRRVGARQLDEGGGSARVRVRARAQAVVVSMRNEDDRLVERPGDDGRQVPELDATESRDVLAPGVLADGEPVERELVAVPLRRGGRPRRPGNAVRVVAGQLDRQRRRGRAVERRREVGGG